MNKLFFKLLLLSALVFSANVSLADDTSGTPAAQPTPPPPQASSYDSLLQQKYNLTEVQMKSLTDSKLPDSQKAQVAQLAKSSGKSVEEVLKMRTEDKMGWGKIAKTLGVHPGELGKAVSEMKKEQNTERKKERDSKRKDGSHHEGKGRPDNSGKGHGKNK